MPEALQVRLSVVVDPMLLLPLMLTEYGGAVGSIACHCNNNDWKYSARTHHALTHVMTHSYRITQF